MRNSNVCHASSVWDLLTVFPLCFLLGVRVAEKECRDSKFERNRIGRDCSLLDRSWYSLSFRFSTYDRSFICHFLFFHTWTAVWRNQWSQPKHNHYYGWWLKNTNIAKRG
ncbi:hypothetical protein NPIL_84331 [Nephila pilipes]|uniref:Secreted protein n=1 Tax=Nephila pilipes TaxID=299642 RepID=A0A8X6QI23_NEPPI|nr:hypothetical protein NPIL_84331 [Nephila pilipes]